MKSKLVKMLGVVVGMGLVSGAAVAATYTLSNPGSTQKSGVVTKAGVGAVSYTGTLNAFGHAMDITKVALVNGKTYNDSATLNCQITGAQSTGTRTGLRNTLDGDNTLICPLFFLGDAPLSGSGTITIP